MQLALTTSERYPDTPHLTIDYNQMGPWPGLEPGPAGPQPTVLTATLPQPYACGPPTGRISSVVQDDGE